MGKDQGGKPVSARARSALRRLFIDGRGRAIGRPLYAAGTRVELAAERAMDAVLAPRGRDAALVNTRLTAVIKTFERPDALQRLLASIRRFYPDLPLIVVDDSREPRHLPGVQTITMPFDSGISVGRNAGVRAVTTPYMLLLDDDFVFYRHTNLVEALRLMEAEPRIDIMGGQVVDLPFYQAADYRRGTMFPTTAQPVHPLGSTMAGLPVYDKVPNFFIARVERLRLVPWDEQLRRMEHADFFTRARGVLATVYNADLRCLHVRSFYDTAYLAHRYDYTRERAYLLMRYHGWSWTGTEQDKEDTPARGDD